MPRQIITYNPILEPITKFFDEHDKIACIELNYRYYDYYIPSHRKFNWIRWRTKIPKNCQFTKLICITDDPSKANKYPYNIIIFIPIIPEFDISHVRVQPAKTVCYRCNGIIETGYTYNCKCEVYYCLKCINQTIPNIDCTICNMPRLNSYLSVEGFKNKKILFTGCFDDRSLYSELATDYDVVVINKIYNFKTNVYKYSNMLPNAIILTTTN
jgi:hypothetical protein